METVSVNLILVSIGTKVNSCKVMSTESQTVLMVRKATWDHEGLYAVKVANACRKCGEEY